MSKVTMTVQQIFDLGLWDQVCEYKGWNPWCLNEGQIDNDEEVEFDTEFDKQKDIIKEEKKQKAKAIICEIENLVNDLYDLDIGTSKIISDACDRAKEAIEW